MVTVVTPKKIRICMDPKDLNQAIKREHYPLLTVEEVVSRILNAKYFSVLMPIRDFGKSNLMRKAQSSVRLIPLLADIL